MGMKMCVGRKLKYVELRDHILGLANQKAALGRPVPTDVDAADVQPECDGDEQGNERDFGRSKLEHPMPCLLGLWPFG